MSRSTPFKTPFVVTQSLGSTGRKYGAIYRWVALTIAQDCPGRVGNGGRGTSAASPRRRGAHVPCAAQTVSRSDSSDNMTWILQSDSLDTSGRDCTQPETANVMGVVLSPSWPSFCISTYAGTTNTRRRMFLSPNYVRTNMWGCI